MTGYNSWTADIAAGVAGCLGTFGAVANGITTAAGWIQKTNYNRTKSAFYSGWKSGNGCVMVVYDNEAPYIYAK